MPYALTFDTRVPILDRRLLALETGRRRQSDIATLCNDSCGAVAGFFMNVLA